MSERFFDAGPDDNGESHPSLQTDDYAKPPDPPPGMAWAEVPAPAAVQERHKGTRGTLRYYKLFPDAEAKRMEKARLAAEAKATAASKAADDASRDRTIADHKYCVDNYGEAACSPSSDATSAASGTPATGNGTLDAAHQAISIDPDTVFRLQVTGQVGDQQYQLFNGGKLSLDIDKEGGTLKFPDGEKIDGSTVTFDKDGNPTSITVKGVTLTNDGRGIFEVTVFGKVKITAANHLKKTFEFGAGAAIVVLDQNSTQQRVVLQSREGAAGLGDPPAPTGPGQ